ncbi:MAG: VWA domain-containing protein [candidate division Zixibacteria bacterium]|nr:VWA domain-containing protein [candidate division Zixibacteria bacterium]
MWNFLNPGILFGLFAAGIPIILHLLARRRVKIVEFSSVAFLNKMKQSRLKYVRLKELLLLLIRTLIIAFLVLGFSRPTYLSSEAGGSGGPSSTVIMLDDSYSMSRLTSGGTLFELAKTEISDFLNEMQPSDEVAVIPFSKIGQAKYSFLSPDPDYFSRLLPEMDVMPDTTHVISALSEGLSALNSSENINRELVILSDFGTAGWSSGALIADKLKDFDGSILFSGLEWNESDNAYITSVDYGGKIIQAGLGFDIGTEVKNGTDRRLDRLLADLYLDGKRISQAEFSLEPSGSERIELRALVKSPGLHNGYVEITDDAVTIDNRRYFSFSIPDKINLLIVGENDELVERIRLALSPPGIAESHISADFLPVSRAVSMGFGNYDAIIFSEYKPNAALASKIRNFMEKGKGVFLIPAPLVKSTYLNSDLGKLGIPLEIERELSPGPQSAYRLEELKIDHPIFAVYRELYNSEVQGKIPEVSFNSIYSVKIKGGLQIPASVSGNRPLLIIHEGETGAVVFSSAPFGANRSDITSSSLFLPMIQRISEYISARKGNFSQGYTVGETVNLNLDRRKQYGKLEIVTPADETIGVAPRKGPSGEIIVYDSPSLPGIYKVISETETVDNFAVNVDTRESESGKADMENLVSSLPQKNVMYVDQDVDITDQLNQFRTGKEYTSAAFGIVLFLLLLEMLIAGRWRTGKEQK